VILSCAPTEFYHWRREVVSRCQPNAGHYALAAAEQQARARGVDFRVVTQNIDRLHQAAGSSNVVEMHGSLWCDWSLVAHSSD
jgi:NAD-dependent SIR2 family protein deacetylase